MSDYQPRPTVLAESVSTHEIVDGPHGPDIVCRAPQGAYCHRRCSTGACEEWSGDECRCGPLIESEACNAVDMIRACGVEDCGPEDDPTFDAEGELVYRGPVDVDWDSNGFYVWSRAVPGGTGGGEDR